MKNNNSGKVKKMGKMEKDKLKLFEEVSRMFSERSEYHLTQWENCHEDRHLAASMAYYTAKTMLQYALKDDWDCLKEYDYYHNYKG